MIILSKYQINKISPQLFYIRCNEHVFCPSCGCQLRVIGSRKRKYINKAGEKITLIIRRLKCSNCKRIHHELPDILVPYKRHESCNIEDVLKDSDNCTVVAEESTFYRWKKWFKHLSIRIHTYLVLISDIVGIKKRVSINIHLMSLLKGCTNWLSKIVTKLVNLNLW